MISVPNNTFTWDSLKHLAMALVLEIAWEWLQCVCV